MADPNGCPICGRLPDMCCCNREGIVRVWAMQAEIDTLRAERMKADERAAIEMSLELEWPRTAAQLTALARCLGPVCTVPENHYKASVRAFLDRQPLLPGPETKEPNRE